MIVLSILSAIPFSLGVFGTNYAFNLNSLDSIVLLKLPLVLPAIVCPNGLQLSSRFPFGSCLELFEDRQHLILFLQHESPQLSAVIINKCHKIMCSICTSYRAFFLLIGGLGRKVTLFCLPTKQSYIFPGACFLSWAGVPFQLAYAFHFSS